MKILVTGANGFIGQNMVKALSSQHEVLSADIDDDIPSIIYSNTLGMVIHLGAISSTVFEDVDTLMYQNYIRTKEILYACNARGVRVQFASSASVYGTQNTLFSEEDVPAPRNHYAWSKLLCEEYIRSHRFHIPIQVFRYFNVYGPHEDHKGDQASPIHKFNKQARETGVIKLFENSELYFRDFIHVDEVIKYHTAFFKVPRGGVYNIGTGFTRSFADIAHEVATETGASIQYIPMPENVVKSYQKYTCAHMGKTLRVVEKYNEAQNDEGARDVHRKWVEARH